MMRDIPGYPNYMADEQGRIYSKRRAGAMGGEVKTFLNANGYMYVCMCIDGRKLRKRVHKLVCLAFYGECPEGYEIDHIDRNKQNNCISNLEYVTHSENMLRIFQ